jgi:hypothetical protein
MALAIDVDRVSEVLLADGWHRCDTDETDVSTFSMDAYEYLWRPDPDDQWNITVMGHGNDYMGHTGFTFTEDDVRVFGPLSAIQAVRTAKEPKA